LPFFHKKKCKHRQLGINKWLALHWPIICSESERKPASLQEEFGRIFKLTMVVKSLRSFVSERWPKFFSNDRMLDSLFSTLHGFHAFFCFAKSTFQKKAPTRRQKKKTCKVERHVVTEDGCGGYPLTRNLTEQIEQINMSRNDRTVAGGVTNNGARDITSKFQTTTHLLIRFDAHNREQRCRGFCDGRLFGNNGSKTSVSLSLLSTSKHVWSAPARPLAFWTRFGQRVDPDKSCALYGHLKDFSRGGDKKGDVFRGRQHWWNFILSTPTRIEKHFSTKQFKANY